MEYIGILLTLLSVMLVGGIAALAIAANIGMIKDEYVSYILEDEEEEALQ